MSLRHNLLASYLGQTYVALVGVLFIPVYLDLMGAEAYGLIGFHTMLQAWFSLIDAGMSPAVARESARFRAGALAARPFRQLLRTLEWLFLLTATLAGVLLALAAETLAFHWLQAQALAVDQIAGSIRIMALIAALRVCAALYRGVIVGSERLVWLNGFNAVIATLRFVLVIPVLWLGGVSPATFFAWQGLVAAIELLCLATFAYRLLPPQRGLRAAFASVLPVLRFSAGIAFASLVWIASTNTDKLLLSSLLSLAEYGHFMVAVLAASAVLSVAAPLGSTVLPRMARLEAARESTQLQLLYRRATQLTTVSAGSLAITIALFGRELLWAWSGDEALARAAAPILGPYALGNWLLALAAFAYYLQYAKGRLRLHLMGSGFSLLLLVPATVYATAVAGAPGAAWAWLILNALLLTGWVPIVHRSLLPGLAMAWLLRDVLAPTLPMLLCAYGLRWLWPAMDGRGTIFVGCALFAGLVFMAGALGSSAAREYLKLRWDVRPGPGPRP
ncbi:MAG: lipopolysaccharide biosynthesis protein [Xanthomonadales bacterium]|nr:hypothetical protein [Xanthomonadales bacterium]MCC6592261.1 lipopolysaccharide biosynthesis protein [Xanthomonadales bacterium]MCE7930673.1 lipopolysaccharide biosynthesis protein [Xanthomonadales bacterium PRO6]